MPRISVGRTMSGKDVFIDSNTWKDTIISETFHDYSKRDSFHALLTIQTLYAKELRRRPLDQAWLESIDSAEVHFTNVLGVETIIALKKAFGIDSAFDAREYGLARLHSHFR